MKITQGEINIEDWKKSGDITEFANIATHVSVDGQFVPDDKYKELYERVCNIQAQLADIMAACPKLRTNKDTYEKDTYEKGPVDCEQCGSLLW